MYKSDLMTCAGIDRASQRIVNFADAFGRLSKKVVIEFMEQEVLKELKSGAKDKNHSV
jgi:hypothetical protein